MPSFRRSLALITLGIGNPLLLCCGGAATSPDALELCSGYPDWTTSPYVLPFEAGNAYKVIQGNCSPPGNGHRGANRYAYDFGMAIGTPIVASRSGTVIEIEETHSDGQVAETGFDNFIVIAHSDGSTALYGHLTHDGAVPLVGAAVSKGDLIAYSGNTGNTGGIPHLHISVQDCDPVTLGTASCPSRPLTFANTNPNPNGLITGQSYPAK